MREIRSQVAGGQLWGLAWGSLFAAAELLLVAFREPVAATTGRRLATAGLAWLLAALFFQGVAAIAGVARRLRLPRLAAMLTPPLVAMILLAPSVYRIPPAHGLGRGLFRVAWAGAILLVLAGVARRLVRGGGQGSGARAWGVLALLGLAALLVGAVASPGERRGLPPLAPVVEGASEGAPEGSSILLVTLDTTRADAISFEPGPGCRTPRLAALAGRGVVFSRAYTEINATAPSHMTMMTGRYPHTHGLYNNRSRVAEGVTSVAEVLRRRGYDTRAWVSASVLKAGLSGIERGFRSFDDRFEPPDARVVEAWMERLALEGLVRRVAGLPDDRPKTGQCRAGVTVARVRRGLRRDPIERPFFLWVHFFDPHLPYDPPAGFCRPGAPPGERYGGEVAYLDEQVGRLFELLEGRGLLGDTLAVVVADHGESLGEHGIAWDHAGMYETTFQVPLLVLLPRGKSAGRVVETPVTTLDLAPAILEAAGLDVPDSLPGMSLLAIARGEGAPKRKERDLFFEHAHQALAGLLRDRWKLILPLKPYGPLRGTPLQLFDLARDPAETRNLAPERPERAARMERDLEAWLEAHPPAPPRPAAIDPATDARLRALGYIR